MSPGRWISAGCSPCPRSRLASGGTGKELAVLIFPVNRWYSDAILFYFILFYFVNGLFQKVQEEKEKSSSRIHITFTSWRKARADPDASRQRPVLGSAAALPSAAGGHKLSGNGRTAARGCSASEAFGSSDVHGPGPKVVMTLQMEGD